MLGLAAERHSEEKPQRLSRLGASLGLPQMCAAT